MRQFRFLIGLIVIGSLAWTGWWFIAATAKQTALNAWLENRRGAGWTAEVADLGVTGFPARLDTIMDDLILSDPRQGWIWEAESFQILGLAYKPNHIIAVWPGTQRLSRRGVSVAMNAEQWRGSVVFVPGLSLPLDRLQMELAGLEAVASNGLRTTVATAQIAARRSPDPDAPPLSYDLYAALEDAAIPPELLEAFDAGAFLGPAIQSIRVAVQAELDTPLDRSLLEIGQPALRAAVIKEAHLRWGEVTLDGEGRVDINASGYPEGRIDIEIANWRGLLDRMIAADMIDPSMSQTLVRGLTVLATLSGDETTLRAPLIFTGGQVALGPVPLGPAPRLPIPRPPLEG